MINHKLRIISIVGARPQFIKLAPFIRTIQNHNEIEHLIVHTGQHYDYEMSQVFFEELGLKSPDYHLGVGSGTHGFQTGEMLKRIEKVLISEKPDVSIVYGDTNSTLAGALAAVKLHIPVVHVEAGLRSFNKKMPEEINRILTDHCSDILFCPTETAVNNLRKEGFVNIINNGKLINNENNLSFTISNMPLVINVGDIMYDSLSMYIKLAEKRSSILNQLNLIINYKSQIMEYYLVTIHRAENTDNPKRLRNIIEALIEISKEKVIIFPVHPRTRKNIIEFNILTPLKFINPVSYLDMLILEKNAKKILTDSGGVQKEAYFFRVPCITLREETEWIETIKSGWNILVGSNKNKIIEAVKSFNPNQNIQNFFGDGKASEKICGIIKKWLTKNQDYV